METINWKVEGMTCGNCALSINKVLTKQGMQKVQVNAVTGEVIFDNPDVITALDTARKNIADLGYKELMKHWQTNQSRRNFLVLIWINSGSVFLLH